ncbi:hypothetical protein H2200_002647 [Cladophialophora chaetospira]|uniref:N-acetyltransferase domain-containing protein n=1 Tax=Cladophialophora chaetospira TaxID=386627 RepID=A0AA39CNR9_9EURO|nr:hypothetical protein H2200_002647 [Cladophialophora chaetospira]
MTRSQTQFEDGESIEIESGALSPEQIAPLLNKLGSHLPYSIPLVRRIQFYLHHPISPTARIFVAAVVESRGGQGHVDGLSDEARDGTGDSGELDLWLLEPQSRKHPWITAHVDLAFAGQTAVWVYGSWESDLEDPMPSSLADSMEALELTHAEPHPTRKALMRVLFDYISVELIPLRPTSPSEEWLGLERTGKYLSKPYSRDKVLFGTVSEKLWALFPREARTRTDPDYWKYIFKVDSKPQRQVEGRDSNVPVPSLPAGYSFGVMKDENLQMVLDRTPIPRTLNTLRQFVSVGLFHESSQIPIGWGFLGKDASLSSLHTEPEHRGKGLAVALGAELLRKQHITTSSDDGQERGGREGGEINGQVKGEGGFTWAHADVSKNNKASLRVMEKLGGKPTWMVMWTEVNMSEVLSATQ